MTDHIRETFIVPHRNIVKTGMGNTCGYCRIVLGRTGECECTYTRKVGPPDLTIHPPRETIIPDPRTIRDANGFLDKRATR